jgi:hypothetical protein
MTWFVSLSPVDHWPFYLDMPMLAGAAEALSQGK